MSPRGAEPAPASLQKKGIGTGPAANLPNVATPMDTMVCRKIDTLYEEVKTVPTTRVHHRPLAFVAALAVAGVAPDASADEGGVPFWFSGQYASFAAVPATSGWSMPVQTYSGQFSLLISLNRPEPPTVGTVADLLAMDRTTLTANLKPLERRGLLKVIPDAQDRRARRLTLTGDGLALLEQAIPIWIATHEKIEGALESEVDALRAELNTLTKVAGVQAD